MRPIKAFEVNSLILLQDVTHSYHPLANPVLKDFSLTVQKGERWAILGPSGCGKSTLLLLVAGLLQQSQGNIRVNSQPVRGPRNETAVILQDYGLFPWKTVEENVLLGLQIRGVSRSEGRIKIAPILQELGLSETAHRFPQQLSGGQRQRVAIARALAVKPDLLLMDEPFSSLDALTREHMQELVLSLALKNNLTMLLVTHGIEEAAFLGEKILVLDGPPLTVLDIVDNPGAKSPDYRRQETYFQCCVRLRQIFDRCGNNGNKKACDSWKRGEG